MQGERFWDLNWEERQRINHYANIVMVPTGTRYRISLNRTNLQPPYQTSVTWTKLIPHGVTENILVHHIGGRYTWVESLLDSDEED